MVGLDSALGAQMALVQQQATIGMMKQSADVQKQMVQMLTETITASNSGKAVDLYA